MRRNWFYSLPCFWKLLSVCSPWLHLLTTPQNWLLDEWIFLCVVQMLNVKQLLRKISSSPLPACFTAIAWGGDNVERIPQRNLPNFSLDWQMKFENTEWEWIFGGVCGRNNNPLQFWQWTEKWVPEKYQHATPHQCLPTCTQIHRSMSNWFPKDFRISLQNP